MVKSLLVVRNINHKYIVVGRISIVLADIIKNIIKNVLTALYQPFWFSVILSVLFMFVYKSYADVKTAVKQWLHWFKTEKSFRKMFVLVFYTVMILFRTLLNRNMWANPLSDVFGSWWIYDENGDLTTEAIENLMLFMPFTVMVLWNFHDRLFGGGITFGGTIWQAVKLTFLFSFTIEMLQLFLRLGTWQLSDLFYNTLGGAIGGVVYYIGFKIAGRKER